MTSIRRRKGLRKREFQSVNGITIDLYRIINADVDLPLHLRGRQQRRPRWLQRGQCQRQWDPHAWWRGELPGRAQSGSPREAKIGSVTKLKNELKTSCLEFDQTNRFRVSIATDHSKRFETTLLGNLRGAQHQSSSAIGQRYQVGIRKTTKKRDCQELSRTGQGLEFAQRELNWVFNMDHKVKKLSQVKVRTESLKHWYSRNLINC